VLKPLGGTDDDIVGLDLEFEGDDVAPTVFPPPSADTNLGNHRAGLLLREAARLGVRSAAAALRSLGRSAVEARLGRGREQPTG
jgi:hypothetical protein